MLTYAVVLLSLSAGALAQSAGVTTRYWDCCKPSCAWSGKAALSSPLKTCTAIGGPIANQDTRSICDGGPATMCLSNGPVVVSDTLAYGTAATALSGQGESQTCCSCFELTFTSAPLIGKKMIVQSINTGGDVGGNQFDLAIPGGGVGIFAQGCPAQFGVSQSVFGNPYGGVSSAAQCNNLPSAMQPGCQFRFGWFQGADNPSVSYRKVACPAALVARTGCLRQGESTDGSSPPAGMTSTTKAAGMTTSIRTSSSVRITTTAQTTTTAAGGNGGALAPKWGQCGGQGWNGPKACVAGTTCKFSNPWYSQCL